jgi:pimeloyl-ACP methyl ester carboxylesterase
MERLISGFCRHTPISDISIQQCQSLLSWCCFLRDWDDLTKDEQNDIVILQQEVQFCLKKEGHTLHESPSGHVAGKHIRHHLEPIQITHRPLFLYVIFFLVERIFENICLYPSGFRKHVLHRETTYWLKNVPGTIPVVLIHGICRGWSFYWKLIQALGHHRTIILLDYDCIKVNSLQLHVPDVKEYCYNFSAILKRHEFDQCDLIGHSYGTFLTTWILRECQNKIRRVSFIDPLTLTVALYETAYYLFYNPPQTMTDWIYYCFVRTNLPLANVLQRNFIWYNMVIKFSEIPEHIDVHVAFSGKEHLLDVALLKQLVVGKKYICWENIHHAECMGNDACIADLVNALREP